MRFVTANDGTLWAGICPDTHHVEPKVCDRRFAAYLAPFRSEEDATVALLAAGAVIDSIASSSKPGRVK